LLSWLAGRTSRLQLLTGAVILPWNNPLRVVERMILLDHLSNGRALFGLGRGLAKREYEVFGVDMSEARERFDEAARMVIRGVETGIVEGDGKFYKQARVEVRPRPFKSFKDRLYSVAMSADSIPICAEIGARMMVFAQKPWAEMVPHFANYQRLFLQHHGRTAPRPTITEFMYIDENADRAAEGADKYIGGYFDILMHHYEMAGEHFAKTKGYGGYAEASERARKTKHEVGRAAYVQNNNFGTPNQILERYEARRKLIGEFDMHVNVSYSGMSKAEAERNMRLYAEKIIPEVRSWEEMAIAS
jgi:alkanesulfonate monooxygenase SsuD/methylene tetrahydromethanopterin reductase-like flavin-dependent oxidoreductase (luciferase family)